MRKKTIIGLMLLAFCLACRYSTPVADFYAEHCYPLIGTVLSRIASIVRFSLEEIVVLAFIVTFVDILVKAIWKKEAPDGTTFVIPDICSHYVALCVVLHGLGKQLLPDGPL